MKTLASTRAATAALAFGALTGAAALPALVSTAAVAVDGTYGDGVVVSPSVETIDVADTEDGVEISISGLQPGDAFEIGTLTPDAKGFMSGASGSADADGNATVTLTVPDGTFVPEVHTVHFISVNGDYDAAPESDAPASFEVTGEAQYPTVELAQTEITADDLADAEAGLSFSASWLEPGGVYTYYLVPPEGVDVDDDFRGTFTADENGEYTGTVVADVADPSTLIGEDWLLQVQDPEGYELGGADDRRFDVVAAPTPTPTETATPTPTETPTPTPTETDDETVEYALTIDPEMIDARDFVDDDKGVMLEVTGVEPGEEVAFTVTPEAEGVDPYEHNATADENGVASWHVYGTSASDPMAYVSDYTVHVYNAAGEKLTGEFEVVSGDGGNPGGGGDDGDRDDNGDGGGGGGLPRTGASLAGLGAGVALLTVGGATVLLTRRRSA